MILPERRVLIYAPRVLPYSQTFILDQAASLQRWRFLIVGRQWVPGGLVESDDVRIRVATNGLVEATRARVTRRIPGLAVTVADFEPDLIHAHFLTGGVEVSNVAASFGIPLVTTAHGFDACWRSAAWWQSVRRWRFAVLRGRFIDECNRRSDRRIVAVSEFIRDELLSLGADPGKVVVHYTGVDTERFRRGERRESPSGVPTILFVGRLVANKGLLDLLDAVARLQPKIGQVRIVVVGVGPDEASARRFAADRRLWVEFMGAISSDAVRGEMSTADVLCVPSRRNPVSGDCEGFGMVFAEAQSMGLPVVSTRCGGVPEAVSHGETGLLVPEGDRSALAAALAEVLGNPELAGALGSRGAERARTDFDLRRQTMRLETIYDQLVAGAVSDEGAP